MDVGRPHRAVVAGIDGDVLVLLAGIARPLSGRDIAGRLPAASHEGVRRSLARLVDQGIVLREVAGGAHLHRLNGEHLAAPAVLALASIRSELWAALRREFAGWDPPARHASAFGSAARGDGDSRSDIDLLVVRPVDVDAEEEPAWRAQIERLATSVLTWTGNAASVIEQSEDELVALLASPPPVLQAIQREAIDLAGDPARTLLDPRHAAT